MGGIDEPVHLAEHSPAWAGQFREEGRRILAALGTAGLALEHIGSTAVPGLLAKPVVDLQLGLEAYPPEPALVEALADLGYEAMGEAGVPGRAWFRLRGARDFNLHVVLLGSPLWRANLALREHLRRSPEARRRYQEAKQAALRAGATTLLAYSAAKSELLAQLVGEALAAGIPPDG